MAKIRDAFCSFCGTAHVTTQSYPRTCGNPNCGMQIWANPIPVSVVLVPVRTGTRTGLFVVRRGIEPQNGRIALVGGFLEEHERWQEGGVREVLEESGVVVDPATLEPFWFTSTEPRPNRVLLFSVAQPIEASRFPPFAVTHETTERGVVFGPDGLAALFAFPLHVRAAERFFAARDQRGPHDYTQV